jgi:WD40 repeat protein
LTEDGSMGARTLSAQTIRLFEPSSGRELATLEAPEPQTLTGLAFSPDGSRLAAVTPTSVVHVWDLRTVRQELAAMKLHWDSPPLPAPSRTNRPLPIVVIGPSSQPAKSSASP